jgi:acyl-CoA thioester hydrolase
MTQSPRLLVHTSLQPIRWGDMDALGHVNNSVYFRYMEQARIEWLFLLQADWGSTQGLGPVIVNASCTFLAPLVYPGEVEVRMYVGDLGRSSMASSYDLLIGDKKYAEGASKLVWIDLSTGRSVPLPDAVTAPLRAATATPAEASGPFTDLD